MYTYYYSAVDQLMQYRMRNILIKLTNLMFIHHRSCTCIVNTQANQLRESLCTCIYEAIYAHKSVTESLYLHTCICTCVYVCTHKAIRCSRNCTCMCRQVTDNLHYSKPNNKTRNSSEQTQTQTRNKPNYICMYNHILYGG